MVQRANGPISPSVVYLGVVTGRSIGTSMDFSMWFGNFIWHKFVTIQALFLLWYVGLDHVWNLSKPQSCSRQSFRSFLTRRAMSGDVSHFFRCWINANDTRSPYVAGWIAEFPLKDTKSASWFEMFSEFRGVHHCEQHWSCWIVILPSGNLT